MEQVTRCSASDHVSSTPEECLADRQLVERFTLSALSWCCDCAIVHLRAWSAPWQTPAGVLMPSDVSGMLDPVEIARHVENRRTIIAGCTFFGHEEEMTARRILPQFAVFPGKCVIFVQVLNEAEALTRKTMDIRLRCHDRILSTGVDELIILDTLDRESLKHRVSSTRAQWECHRQRMRLIMASMCEEEPMPPDEFEALNERHRRLLWESIPRALMPHFKLATKSLVETDMQIGKYTIVKRVETQLGNMIFASHEDKFVTIKVLDKAAIFTPGELEGIYREFRFLSEILTHPNIIKCTEMYHSESWLYLVFEDHGSESLQILLSRQARKRLDAPTSMNIMSQVVQALVYCHSMELSHRNITLHHVNTAFRPDDQLFQCKLVDFHTAMVGKGNATSRTMCGVMPTMAPEMAMGESYWPMRVDVWSAGILLLEVAAGLGSLKASIQTQFDEDATVAALAIVGFFDLPHAHDTAFRCLGADYSQMIIDTLVRMLQVNSADRCLMKNALGAE